MNPLLRGAYAALAHAAVGAARLAPDGTGKFARALRARRGIRGRFARWSTVERDPARSLVWLHAPSVGEGLQARPVIDLLRAEHPRLQLAYTHFSPSAEKFARALPVDFADYLPFDTGGEARAALATLRPEALVFSKLDVWPVLVREAREAGVRTALISATVAPGSRRRGLGVSLLRDSYSSLDAVGAVSPDDASRLVEIGVRGAALEVTGDTRYDQVDARARSVDRDSALLAPLSVGRPTLVAGSTWPADERQLLSAWLAVRNRVDGARLILAPHEPTAAHLEPIERWSRDHRVPLSRLGAADAGSAELVLVDRVGVLGDLYAVADAAFVGGGFHGAGLHSVLEPAAFGVPVVFGPRWSDSRDAALLISEGGGREAADAAELAEQLTLWLGDRSARQARGAAARALVERNLGAARRSLELVLRLLR